MRTEKNRRDLPPRQALYACARTRPHEHPFGNALVPGAGCQVGGEMGLGRFTGLAQSRPTFAPGAGALRITAAAGP